MEILQISYMMGCIYLFLVNNYYYTLYWWLNYSLYFNMYIFLYIYKSVLVHKSYFYMQAAKFSSQTSKSLFHYCSIIFRTNCFLLQWMRLNMCYSQVNRLNYMAQFQMIIVSQNLFLMANIFLVEYSDNQMIFLYLHLKVLNLYVYVQMIYKYLQFLLQKWVNSYMVWC